MNNRALTLSLVMGVLAIFFVQSYVSSIEEEAQKKYGSSVLVLVSKKDIKEMEVLNETMLEFQAIPKKFLEPAAISLEKSAEEDPKSSSKTMKSVLGAIALVPMKKGEQLGFNKITDPSIRTGLSNQVAPGKRAVSIPVSEVTGLSKLVKPGDRVDLIVVLDLGGGKVGKVAKTLLQDVVVLSIGRYIVNNLGRTVELDPSGEGSRVRSLVEDFSFSSVNLEVDPEQAQSLALVLNSGENALTLSLRNNDDTERRVVRPTTLKEVYGAGEASP